MKTLIWIIVILVIVGGVYWFINQNAAAPTDDMPDGTGSPTVESSGTVTAINLDQVPVDGPALVTIETAAGEEEVIAVPSFGRNLCAATDLLDVYTLAVGNVVEVRGAADPDGRIVPCTAADHYLKLGATN